MDHSICKEFDIISYNNGVAEHIRDAVVEENPLTIFINDQQLVTMVCSPSGLNELAVGFLLSEGLLRHASDILEISIAEDKGSIRVRTSNQLVPANRDQNHHITSGGGKSGTNFRFIEAALELPPVTSEVQFTPAHLLKMIDLLQDRSITFKRTGGVHNAALANNEDLICMFEDIGRHNAVDKVLGYAFLNQIPCNDKILILSGRIASEMLLKAARAGIPVVLSRAAPTGLTIDLARSLNITVIGFARGQRLSIYTHPERILI